MPLLLWYCCCCRVIPTRLIFFGVLLPRACASHRRCRHVWSWQIKLKKVLPEDPRLAFAFEVCMWQSNPNHTRNSQSTILIYHSGVVEVSIVRPRKTVASLCELTRAPLRYLTYGCARASECIYSIVIDAAGRSVALMHQSHHRWMSRGHTRQMWLIDSRLRLLRLASLLVAIPRLYIYTTTSVEDETLFSTLASTKRSHTSYYFYILYILFYFRYCSCRLPHRPTSSTTTG